MGSGYSSRSCLTSVVILLLALQYSTAMCYQGYIGVDKKDQLSETKYLWGRKMLQDWMKGKSSDIQERSKPVDVDSHFPVPQTDIHTQKDEGSKEFMEAADEVATLMRRDYRGEGRPRRKPPINNGQPKH